MTDTSLPTPRPAEFKTEADGRGGLIRVVLHGEPHDGHELFMDELDLPEEIYTSADPDRFEWWPAAVKDVMAKTALGGDPAAPPVLYVLRIPVDTRIPEYVSATKAR